MKENKINYLNEQFLKFIFNLTKWLHKNYFKEFNINGNKNHCISDRQFTILVFVHRLKMCTISDLQKELNVSNSSLSIVVSKLVKGGYLKRSYDIEDKDRRKVYLSLTDKGKDILIKFYNRLNTIFDDFYNNLNENKKQDFKEGIKKLNNVFND
ncbi:MarR family winged helix-turn-helix transcriptional regulator [Defluviitalea phaphyphila]|uniref:MarR family winged helix-turn-helix transcriptional regulator n=1 Tax=Defluviitalea phaphyphila TaxID=1473580 RepID=UPI00072FB604|nr:MarR family transcriptional regulator [Defluviitalea phaphyphila]